MFTKEQFEYYSQEEEYAYYEADGSIRVSGYMPDGTLILARKELNRDGVEDIKNFRNVLNGRKGLVLSFSFSQNLVALLANWKQEGYEDITLQTIEEMLMEMTPEERRKALEEIEIIGEVKKVKDFISDEESKGTKVVVSL